MIKTKTRFFILVTIFAAIIILILDIRAEIKLYDILIELNGLVFDLLIFGILITVYEAVNEKKEKITRYKEEINDYRHLDNETYSYRLIGTIKRLLEIGEKEIDLSFSYLIRTFESPTKINKWSFVYSKLFNCKFISKQFDNCSFYSAHFKDVVFGNVVFSSCDFEFAIFESCVFSDCIFKDINFNYAYIQSQEWLSDTINKNKKLSKILEQYVISENTISFKNKNYYQLINKSHNTKIAVEREILQNQISNNILNKMI
jgi:hypothetical protein